MSEKQFADVYYNDLKPAEAERLACLIEEASEIQKIACKILRHGYESYHPDTPKILNRDMLAEEIGQLNHVVGMMVMATDVSINQIDHAEQEHSVNIRRWLHHQ